MMEEVSDEVAERTWGKYLHIASLGVVVEKEKIRVVHDASHGVQINHRIRTQDQLRMPGAGEIRALLGEYRETGKTTFGLLGDASKAHRRVKVHQRDWGFQACRLRKGHVWVNKVGTYGVASAGYWWGRLAAAILVRLPYYMIGSRWSPEFLLFADDWFAQGAAASELGDLGVLVLILTSLGVPLKWSKFRGGQVVTWIGYEVDLKEHRVGITEVRAKWLRDWLRECVRQKTVDLADLLGVLGRMAFAMGPLDYMRPFISPIYSWSSAVGARGKARLPWSMAFLFELLARILDGPSRTLQVQLVAASLGEAFRADAKAEGMTVVVGGWESLGGR